MFKGKFEKNVKSKIPTGDGKSRNMGKKGRLVQVARNNLRKCFTKAIKRHARAGILSIAEQDLKQGLMASLYHNLKIQDPERQHQFCPSESWCACKRSCVVKEKPHHLEPCFEELLLPSKTKYFQKFTAIHDENRSSCFVRKIRMYTAF